jgi:hypothetical protein
MKIGQESSTALQSRAASQVQATKAVKTGPTTPTTGTALAVADSGVLATAQKTVDSWYRWALGIPEAPAVQPLRGLEVLEGKEVQALGSTTVRREVKTGFVAEGVPVAVRNEAKVGESLVRERRATNTVKFLPLGDEFKINTYTSGDQKYSSITQLTDNRFVVTWQSNGQDGSDSGIYGQVFDSNGRISSPVGVEFQINTYTTRDQDRPCIARLTDSRFIVVWESDGQDNDTGGRSLHPPQ